MGDKIPIGVIYEDEKPSFTEQLYSLKDSALVEKGTDLEKVRGILKSYT